MKNVCSHLFFPITLQSPYKPGESTYLSRNQVLISLITSTAAGIITSLVAEVFIAVALGLLTFYGVTYIMKRSNQLDSLQTNQVEESIESIPQGTKFTAQIAIKTRNIGYVDLNQKMITEEMRNWKDEEGKNIFTEEPKLCLELMIFKKSKELDALFGGDDLCLPASYFENLNDGNTLRFIYKDEIVEFKINQLHVSKQTMVKISNLRKPIDSQPASFAEILSSTVQNGLKDLERGSMGRSCELYNPLEDFDGYALDEDSAIYHAFSNQSPIQKGREDFRKQENPQKIRYDVYRKVKNNNIRFVLEMCGISEQFDIVINKIFLSFYAKEDSNIKDPEGRHIKQFDCEYLLTIPWKKIFENLSFEQMKKALEQAKISNSAGLFTIEISQ